MSKIDITSIFKNQECVCVGFATLLKEMCNRLEIECYSNSCTVIEKDTGNHFGHANNIIVLDDKVYYCDACFDCDAETRPKDNYAYCLLSIEDTKITDAFGKIPCELKDKKEFILHKGKKVHIKVVLK